ncbi:MAG: hypothetical protein N3C13_05205 [Aquificaceae bacterium]|nr:hypothetical protein [Aquificaceae bacterium]
MRQVHASRRTRETKVELTLNLDGEGRHKVQTPVGFLTHMVETLAKHGRFDLELYAEGDVEVSHLSLIHI